MSPCRTLLRMNDLCSACLVQEPVITTVMGSLEGVIHARRQMEAAGQVLIFDVRGTFEPVHQRSLQAIEQGVSSRSRKPLKRKITER